MNNHLRTCKENMSDELSDILDDGDVDGDEFLWSMMMRNSYNHDFAISLIDDNDAITADGEYTSHPGVVDDTVNIVDNYILVVRLSFDIVNTDVVQTDVQCFILVLLFFLFCFFVFLYKSPLTRLQKTL